MEGGDEVVEDAGEVVDPMEHETDDEEVFDISLAALHSYMGEELVEVGGRSVLEAGWEGKVPVIARQGTVFPGETVPLLLTNRFDAMMLEQVIHENKLFGLLVPDESDLVTGYGVLCEIFEVADRWRGPAEALRPAFTCKARALHRFRFVDMPKYGVPIHVYRRVQPVRVRVLPEALQTEPLRPARLPSLDPLRRARTPVQPVRVRVLPEALQTEPLRPARLPSLDPLRRARTPLDRQLRALDAATTPWPLFVYDMFDYRRIRAELQKHFDTLHLDKMPEEPVALSFWVAANLTTAPRERLALFLVDEPLLRLNMALRFIERRAVLCCGACGALLARRDHVLPMSSEGVHANYTNIGGYMHDIVTVSQASNVRLSGEPSAEFSWFPGYTWTIADCASCGSHVGWRFDASRVRLRPRQFFGLCRNYMSHSAPTPPPTDWDAEPPEP